MAILHRKCGEHVCTTDSLSVAVLSISGTGVNFAICDTTPEAATEVLSRPLAEACRNNSCYFWFPQGGRCTLVARCEKGRSNVLVGTVRLNLVGISAGAVTVAVNQSPQENEAIPARHEMSEAAAEISHATSWQPLLRRKMGPVYAAVAMRFRWSYIRRAFLGQLAAVVGAIVHRS